MPVRHVAAKRYAQAVFAIAQAEDTFDRWSADLAWLQALAAEPNVAAFLASSKMEPARKADILTRGLEGLHPQLRNLAQLLVRKGRISLVDQIAEEFGELLNQERGVAVARVVTAVPLSDETRRALIDAVKRGVGASDVQLQESVSREIIGGLVIQVGDRLIDGSVRTRLQHLRRSMEGRVGTA